MAFTFVPIPAAHAGTPTSCTTNGIGISTDFFVNGVEVQPYAHVGDSVTYNLAISLVRASDCNIINGTIYFLMPNDVKSDNACGGIGTCDIKSLTGVVTVATNVSITRALFTDPISSATCSGTPAPIPGTCTWDVPGSYTVAVADLVNTDFDGAACNTNPDGSTIPNPCQVVGLASVDGTALTTPTLAAHANANTAVTVIQPAISVAKSTSPKVEAGGSISVTATVTNTGNAELTGVAAIDDHAGPLTCAATTLDPGQSTTCTGSFTAPSTPGTVTNTVTASGTDALGQTVTSTASASTTVIQVGVTITKTADAKVEANGTVHWSANITSTMTGGTGETFTVTDTLPAGASNPSAITCTPVANGGTLSPGQSTTCSGTYTAPLTPGTITDTVSVTATDQTGATATATASASTLIIHPAISVTKTATAKVEVGGTISVSANVTNTGNTGLTGITVSDDHAGALTCPGTTLAVNATMTCTGSYTAPGTPGTVTDTVTATGTDQTGANATASAKATTTVIQVGVSVTMSCSPSTQPAPGTITWTAVETNTGTASETLTDVFFGTAPGTSGPSTVAPGGSVTFTETATGLAAGSYTTSVNATATDQTGATATASASATCTVTPPAQVTRTYGYWAQHWRITQYVLETDLGGVMSWSCVTLGSGDSANVATGDVIAGMTASIPWTSTGAQRTALDHARMQLAQQLIAAILNNAAFGSSPGAGVIAAAESAYCGTNTSLILHYVGVLDSFNQSGDNLAFPASADSCPPSGGYNGKCLSIIADPKGSQALAKPEFPDWDTPGSVST